MSLRAPSASQTFVFPCPFVQASALAASLGLSTAALLPYLVPFAAAHAIVPTSAYPVGAAALGASGSIYLGANLELPRAPLAASVHAEQCAVASAAQAGERGLVRIAVSAPPCGHCRQFCNELAGAEGLEFVFEEGGGAPSVSTLDELLPRAFGPADLARGPSSDGSMAVAMPAGGPRPPTPPPPGCGGRAARGATFLMDGSGVGRASLELEEDAAEAVMGAMHAPINGDGGGATDASTSAGHHHSWVIPAADAALEAAAACHAPHTHCPAGVALVWERAGADGQPALVISAGGVIESAAYNPTLPPLQAAAVAAFVAGMDGWGAVRAAVLVERGAGARISHAGGTAAGLACVGEGGVPLTVLRARWRGEGGGA